MTPRTTDMSENGRRPEARSDGRPRLFVAFDDTDTADADRGTGKLARWFADRLGPDLRPWGVVRVQLPVLDGIAFTSHNSAAVVVAEPDGGAAPDDLDEAAEIVAERAVAHICEHFLAGSDPGLCVAWETNPAIASLISFGRYAAARVVTQAEAEAAAQGVRLSGHGGTCDGIIGAAAAVGLVAHGWGGRLIEYRWDGGGLRDMPDPVPVADLERAGITVVSIDRDAPLPAPFHSVQHGGWLRPRLWGHAPVLPVRRAAADRDDAWVAVGPRSRSTAEHPAETSPSHAPAGDDHGAL